MNTPAAFDWHDVKDERNLANHGLSLGFGARVFLDDNRVDFDASRPEDGEERRKAVGMIEGKLYTAVYTMRGPVCWLISVRRSNTKESKAYGP